MIPMEKGLKDCPFCGGAAQIAFVGNQGQHNWKGFIKAKCTVCGASAKGAYYHGEPIEISLDETVGGMLVAEAWNLRAQNGGTA